MPDDGELFDYVAGEIDEFAGAVLNQRRFIHGPRPEDDALYEVLGNISDSLKRLAARIRNAPEALRGRVPR